MDVKTYSVRTWDTDEQAFTPQVGMSLPWRGLTLWQLRRALQELRSIGYSAYRYRDEDGGHDSDPWVLVERSDEETDGKR